MEVSAFWDEIYDEFDPTAEVSGVLALPDGSESIAGRHVLIVACGTGEHVVRACRAGAFVTALDISPKAVKNAVAMAQHNGFEITPVVADGASTGLPNASFDMIWGSAVLHHLEHERAAIEFARLLRPDGNVVMMSEPTFFNPLLRIAYQVAFGKGRTDRRRSAFFGLFTRIGDDFEKPIERRDLETWYQHFDVVELRPRGFLFFSKLGQVLPRRLLFFKKLMGRLDKLIVAIAPSVTKWSYEYDFVFSRPHLFHSESAVQQRN